MVPDGGRDHVPPAHTASRATGRGGAGLTRIFIAAKLPRCHELDVGIRTALALGVSACAVLACARAEAEDASAIPLAELTMTRGDAPTPAGGRLIEQLRTVMADVRETKYQARTVVRPRDGYYAWDCSGMAAWVLERSAPRAMKSVHATGGGARAVARDFFRAIARAPTGRARGGWQRVHVGEVRPGDTFAWLKSPISTSKITGHVGFIVGFPEAVAGWPGAYAVRIVDSTRLPHQDDAREMDGDGGFGFGTMVFVTSTSGEDAGEVKAYAWFGTEYLPRERSRRVRVGDGSRSGTIDDLPIEDWPYLGFMPAHVVFGRPSA